MKTNNFFKKIYYKVIFIYISIMLIFIPLKTIHPNKHHEKVVSQSFHHNSFILPPPILAEPISISAAVASAVLFIKGLLVNTIPAALAKVKAFFIKHVVQKFSREFIVKKLVAKVVGHIKANINNTLTSKLFGHLKGKVPGRLFNKALNEASGNVTEAIIDTKKEIAKGVLKQLVMQVYTAEVKNKAKFIAYAVTEETSHYLVDKVLTELGESKLLKHKKSIISKVEKMMKKTISLYLSYKEFRLKSKSKFRAYTYIKKGAKKALKPFKPFFDKVKGKFKEKVIDPVHKKISQKLEPHIQKTLEKALKHVLAQRIMKRIEQIVGNKAAPALQKGFLSQVNKHIVKNQKRLKNIVNKAIKQPAKTK